jgi:hypothetical protein
VKVNVDVMISKNSSKPLIAIVARDKDFLGASVLVLEGYANLETTEVVACCEGLVWLVT